MSTYSWAQVIDDHPPTITTQVEALGSLGGISTLVSEPQKRDIGQRVRVGATVAPVYEWLRWDFGDKVYRKLERTVRDPVIEGVYVGRRFRYEGEVWGEEFTQSVWVAKKRLVVLLVAVSEKVLVECLGEDVSWMGLEQRSA